MIMYIIFDGWQHGVLIVIELVGIIFITYLLIVSLLAPIPDSETITRLVIILNIIGPIFTLTVLGIPIAIECMLLRNKKRD